MAPLQVKLVTKNYDYLMPLVCGDVAVEGVDLIIERDSPRALERVLNEPDIDGGEASLNRSLLAVASRPQPWVLLPVFIFRGFQLRHFYVRRSSDIRSLTDLKGKRVGLEYWATSGSVWCRAALRSYGVDVDEVEWFLGPMQGGGTAAADFDPLPASVRLVPAGGSLQAMLLNDDLDVVICWKRPAGFYEEDSPLVRLFGDFRAAEQEYLDKVGFVPGYHVMRVNRDLVEANPWLPSRLYRAFDESMAMARRNRVQLAETTPWLLAEIEDTVTRLGEEWWPNGIGANIEMLRTFCREQADQGLARQPLDPTSAFHVVEESN